MASATFNVTFGLVKSNPMPCGTTTIAEDGAVAKVKMEDGANSLLWALEMAARGLFTLTDVTDPEDGVGLIWELRSKVTGASVGVDLILNKRVDGLTVDGSTPIPDDTLYATITLEVGVPIEWFLRAFHESWCNFELEV